MAAGLFLARNPGKGKFFGSVEIAAMPTGDVSRQKQN